MHSLGSMNGGRKDTDICGTLYFVHSLPLIYFEQADRATAEGTFTLNRAVCLLDIVDEEWTTDVSSL